VEDGSGRLQLVGAGGDVLGELPIYPAYSALGGGEEHVVFLHQGQVLALDRDGRLAWEHPVPLDNLAQRGGVPQLATAPGIVVVCGTGRSGERSGGSMHTPRRGSLIALDEDGRVLWQRSESDDEELWFQMSAVVSPDGGTVVTCHAKANVLEIRAWDAAEGDLLWTQTAVRHSGFRCVSVAPGAALVVLAQCDNQTSVDAWDGEGTTVWSGNIPLASREAKIVGDHWLAGEQWIVKLSSRGAEL
jgi:outer membrane protein assembly factor BamB